MPVFFDKLLIIGSGSICINVIKSLIEKDVKPICLLYKEHTISSLSMMLKNKGLEHYTFDDKNKLKEFLESINDNTLILSVNNIYLFPKSVVRKPNIKIINFHNALLPYHRGMNAPTWTIFEQDKFAGITWHIVNENIDDGDIIIQKKIELNNTETALYLIKQLMTLAFCAYKEIEDDILNWTIKTTPMPKTNTIQIHYSKDVPNNGFYNEKWDNLKKSAFLRALDWGCINQFQKPKLIKNDEVFIINNYKINKTNTSDIEIELSLENLKISRGGDF